jgi:hypothetical protein
MKNIVFFFLVPGLAIQPAAAEEFKPEEMTTFVTQVFGTL